MYIYGPSPFKLSKKSRLLFRFVLLHILYDEKLIEDILYIYIFISRDIK